jgi:TPR repeat protein
MVITGERQIPPCDEMQFRFTRAGEGSYRLVVASPDGQAEGTFAMPLSEYELETLHATIDNRLSVGLPTTVRHERAKQLGARLFDALVADREVRAVYDFAGKAARERGHGLRVTLYLTATPELAELPWELLYSRPEFLAQSVWTPVVRYVGREGQRPSLDVEPPLRILGMVSSPRRDDLPELDTVLERELLDAAVGFLRASGFVDVRWLSGGTLEELQHEVAYGRDFHVFHFIGHGELRHDGDGAGVLLLENPDGGARPVTGEHLGAVLCDRRTLRLAVLNACEGASASVDDALSGVAGALVERDVPAVVAMQAPIGDDAAVAFARGLYSTLVDGHSVDAAVTEARRTLIVRDDLAWAVPVLFMNVPDGGLFNFDFGNKVRLDANLLRPPVAVEELRRADRAGDAQAAFDLGRVLGEHQRWEEAEDAYRRADARGHPRAATVLGTLLFQRGDHHGAMEAFARGMDRGEADAAHSLGSMLAERGDTHQAEGAYARAVDLGSRDAPANLGTLRFDRGDLRGAEEAYRIGDERGNPAAVTNLGLVLRERGDHEGARACFERASDLGSREGAYNLGSLYAEAGDDGRAEEAYRLADERGDAKAAFNVSALALKRGDAVASYAAMRRAAERNHPDAVAMLGRFR